MEGRRLWSVGGGHLGLSRNGTQKWQFQWPKWSSLTTLWGFTQVLLNFWTSFLCKDQGWPTPKTPGNGNGMKWTILSEDFPMLSHQKGWNFPWISHCLRLTWMARTFEGCARILELWMLSSAVSRSLFTKSRSLFFFSDCHWTRSNKIDRRWSNQQIYGVSPKRRFLMNNTASIGSKAAIPEIIRFTSAQQPDDFELNTQESNFRDKDSLSNREIGQSFELFGVWAF